MATFREIQARFSASAQGMKSTIGSVTRDLRGMQRETSTASQVMSRGFDNTGRSVEKFRSQIFDLEKRTDSQAKSVESARSEYDKMVATYGENSAEAERAKQALDTQIASHKDLQYNLQNTQGEFKRFNHEIETQSTLAHRMGDGFTNFSQTLGGISEKAREVGGSLTKYITLPVAGVVASAAGITAAFGWQRLVGVDNAQAQLRGLGYETEDVERITENLVGALDGGMMTMAEATSAAATAMAAGVKEGDELTRYIQILDSAVVGGTGTFQEMEQIFGRIVDQGHMTRNEFDMIAQRMPGFSSAVQEHMGISSEEMYEMLRNGEITTDQFLDIMDGFAGDMATEYAKTWSGMVQNTKAYIGILGENFLGGVFEQSKESIAEFIELLSSEEVQEWAKEMGLVLGDAFERLVTWVKSAIDWFMNLDSSTQKIIGGFAAFAVAIGPVLLGLGTLGGIIAKVSGGLGVFLKWLAPIGKNLGIFSFRLADSTKNVGLLARAFGVLSGPVGWTITAIAALAAGFVLAYNKSETFRNFIDGLRDKFTDAWQSTMEFKDNFITAFDAIFALFKGDDAGIDLLKSLGLSDDQIDIITGAIDTIKGAFEKFRESVQNALDGIADFFIDQFNGIKSWWDSDGELILSAMTTSFEWAMDAIGDAVKFGLDFVVSLFETFAPIVEGIWNTLWPTIEFIAKNTWSTIELVIGTAMDVIQGIISAVSAIIEGDWEAFGTILKDTASSIKDRIVEHFGNMKDNAIELINDLTGGAIDKFVEMRDGMINRAIEIKDGVINRIVEMKDGVVQWVTDMYNDVTGWFSELWTNLTTKASEIRDGVVDRFTQMKNRVIAKVNEIFGPTIETFQNIYNSVTGKVTELRITLTEIWNRIRMMITATVRAIWSNVTQRFTDVYNDVKERMSNLRTRLNDIWTDIRTRITDIVSSLYNRVRDWFLNIYNNVRDRTENTRNRVSAIWNNLRDRVVNTALNLYNRLSDRFLSIYNNIRDRVIAIRNTAVDWFTRMRDTVVNRVTNLYNRIKNLFGNIYTTIHDKMRDAKNKAVGFATDLYDGANAQFENLVDGAKDMMTGIGNAIDNLRTNVVNKAKSLGTGIANAGIDGFNGLIKGINWVADKLGAPKIGLISRIGTGGGGNSNVTRSNSSRGAGRNPQAIRASTGLRNHQGGPVLVGDKGPGNSIGGGSSTREIVELPNKQRFLMDGDILIDDAPRGMNVLSNRETERELDLLKAFNPDNLTGGSGSFNGWLGKQLGRVGAFGAKAASDPAGTAGEYVGKAVGKGVSLASDILDYAENPMKLFTDILSKYVNFDMVKYPLNFATSGISYLRDAAVEKFKSWFEDFGSGGDGSHILGKKIIQPFGRYIGNISFNGGRHYGIDTNHKFDPLLSPVNGRVTKKWWDRGGGNSLEVTTDKHIWWFMHLSKIMKQVGDTVRAGMRLGTTGNSGNFVVGSGHLHTQVHPREKGGGNHNAINPLPILKNLSGYFRGGITSGIPELAWLNEEGFRESIISHNPAHRERSEHIWNATGQQLGFGDDETNALLKENNALLRRVADATGETADNTEAIKHKEPRLVLDEFKKRYDRFNDDRTILV